jgi:hypothetical protein
MLRDDCLNLLMTVRKQKENLFTAEDNLATLKQEIKVNCAINLETQGVGFQTISIPVRKVNNLSAV